MMPTYDYTCTACNTTMEIFHPMAEKKKKCPKCGALKLKKLISGGTGIVFKGKGFYVTDNKKQHASETLNPQSEKTKEGDSSKKNTKDSANSTSDSSAKNSSNTSSDSSKNKEKNSTSKPTTTGK